MNNDNTILYTARALELARNNELILYCWQHGLNPRPEGINETNGYANCPSGGNHPIIISTLYNQWGCGYCRKKGELEELKQFIESRRSRKTWLPGATG